MEFQQGEGNNVVKNIFLGLCMVVSVFCFAVFCRAENYERLRSFFGYFKDTNGNVIPGAKVDITAAYSFQNIVASTITDINGYYEFENTNVDSDGYILASKDNYYTSYLEGYLISDNSQTTLYIEKNHGKINMAGDWEGSFKTDYFSWYEVTLKLKQDGNRVRGKWKDKRHGVRGKFWGNLKENILNFQMTSKRKEYVDGCKGKYRGIAIVGSNMGSLEYSNLSKDYFYHTFTGKDCEGEYDNGHGSFWLKD